MYQGRGDYRGDYSQEKSSDYDGDDRYDGDSYGDESYGGEYDGDNNEANVGQSIKELSQGGAGGSISKLDYNDEFVGTLIDQSMNKVVHKVEFTLFVKGEFRFGGFGSGV